MAVSRGKRSVRSMAIWFSGKQTKTSSVELHFNLWRINHYKRRWYHFFTTFRPDFLDVGIMISDISILNSIFFYLPMKVDHENIRDLGPKFSEPSLATDIFNENLKTTNSNGGAPIELTKESDGQHYCCVFSFPVESLSNKKIDKSAMTVEHESDGTLITITESALNAAAYLGSENKKVYIRFRVRLSGGPENEFIISETPNDSPLTSGYDVIECLDLRLNDTRNLPDGIRRKMINSKHQGVEINRLHFLLAAGVAADFVGGHRNFHKCRLLEKGIWKDYVDGVELPSQMVIYHWKEPASQSAPSSAGSQPHTGAGLDDFNAFVKLRLRISRWSTILSYLIVALVLGAVGGIAGNGGWEFVVKPKLLSGRASDSSDVCKSLDNQALSTPSGGNRNPAFSNPIADTQAGNRMQVPQFVIHGGKF